MSYTSNKFIRAVQRSAVIPISQHTYTEEDILEIASEEIDISVVPQLLELHEDYLLFEEKVDASGAKAYDIPYRAIGSKLRDVAYDDGSAIYELVRVPVDRISDYQVDLGTSTPVYYYIKNNQINLLGTAPTSGTFRFFYYFRPGRLVKDERAGIITSIDTSLNKIIVSKVPEHFGENMLTDLIQARTPHRTLDFDVSVVSVNHITGEIVLSKMPDNLRVGDYISKAEETIVVQIPSEIHPVLIQRVAYRINESQGDAQAMNASKVRVDEMEKKTQVIVDNRVEASPQKIVRRNGFLNQLKFTRRRIP